jgi:3'-5' exoribonuclease
MDQQKLREIGYGEAFLGYYALRRKEKRDYQGKCYLVLELADSSGRFAGVYWGDDAANIFDDLDKATVVKIKGVMNEYRERPQIKVFEIRTAGEDEFEASSLLPDAEIAQEELAEAIQNIVESIKDENLQNLLCQFFEDADFLSNFISAPAGKLWHGAYVGGLAEHSLNVARICDHTASLFRLCRRDLLVAGALLHDIGKTVELAGDAAFDYTTEGRLIGHIVLGDRLLRRVIARMENFPTETANELSHMILSHHGDSEMGSPIVPMTIEAAILHHADYMESQANAFTHVIEKELELSEDFSSWVKPASRMLYLKPYRKNKE